MNDLELIEDYFSGRLSADDRARFETSLQSDSALAETVAFYLSAQQAAHIEARSRRKAEFEKLRTQTPTVRRFPISTVIALAASVVLILGLGAYWFFQRQSPSAEQLADHYIQENYAQLSTTMDGRNDSLQTGVNLYNAGKLNEAGAVFTDLLQRQPDNDRVLQYAGLVSLRTGQYDQAVDHFHRLGERKDLFANPGLFLEAITRLKRNQSDDKSRAETLLKTVIEQDMEGKAMAERLQESL